MKCTDCGSVKVITYDTRRIEDKVVRKRRCTDCDSRFYTLEQYMTEDELEEVQELRKKQLQNDPRGESQSESEEAV